MERVGDEHALAIAPLVASDLLATAQDHDLGDEALHHHVLEAIGGRYRVVVGPIAHERHRRDPPAALLTGLQRHRRQRPQHCAIGHQPLPDRLDMAAGMIALSSTATIGEHGVQIVEAGGVRDRHHEVGARELDQPFDLAFIVALGRPGEAIAEQVMAAQFGEGARAFALPVAQDLRHRDRRVVVQDR